MNDQKIAKKSTKKTAKKAAKSKKTYGPDIYKRNNHGLLENAEYHFNEDGSVDWRSMIKPEFLYPNKGWFDFRKQEVPASIEGLKDNQLLIMLGGIKEIARLRGYDSVSFEVNNISEGYVVAKCKINWIDSYENSAYYEDVANASLENTDSFCEKFLETIACNRAFVRCVRNFLNIHIVGADEIDKSNNKDLSLSSRVQLPDNASLTPNTALQSAFSEKSGTDSFDEFKQTLRQLWTKESYRNEEAKDWNSFSDIPAKECRKLLSLIKKL